MQRPRITVANAKGNSCPRFHVGGDFMGVALCLIKVDMNA